MWLSIHTERCKHYISEHSPSLALYSVSFLFIHTDTVQNIHMSFGWSAGDIGCAVSIILRAIKALDDAKGAPADYRSTVAFFQSGSLTLQRLQSLICLGKSSLSSPYENQICKELEFIKLPLERFLTISQNSEPFLWNKATPGRLNHIPEKLLWRFKDSKAVWNFKEEIKDHVDILDKWLITLLLTVSLSSS